VSRMYNDGVVILDLDYLVAAQLTCRGGQWMIDVLLALGSEGQTLSCSYPAESMAQHALIGIVKRLEEPPDA